MKEYNHKEIESKWQKKWEKEKIFNAKEDENKKKYYCLIEFPYVSGEGLHVGHVRSYAALDTVARKKRMEGYNVLYPIGWDAFGLPTENYAIKTGLNPRDITKENTANFRRQLKSLGFSFDWSREVDTSDPAYYKWTQWIFLKFFEKGLAYKKKMNINWCVSCKIGLANEEVVGGVCERCGGKVEIREKEQWMLAITKYADRLYDDLDDTDFLEKIKIQQRNWIGRSEGALIKFPISNFQFPIEVFTTRPDTLFGATYLVVAPEHQIISNLKSQISNLEEVENYIEETKRKKEIERLAEGKEKTGVELKGVKAINPANNEEIPIYIADYVLASYGTGAIMAVPAHDERDYDFAKKYELPIIQVVQSNENLYTGHGTLINSGEFDGMGSKEGIKEITEFVGGELKTVYGLRDWVFSRQRYWGEPIPLIFCENCADKIKSQKSNLKNKSNQGELKNPGWFADENLPLILPEVKNYQPTDTGESPLAKIEDWVNVQCPKCGGDAKRETDTMPNWAGSSWYWLRYTDPRNDREFASKDKLNYWTPVDWYNGGMEHTTLHLLYSRFWHKFLFDLGLVPTKEPYKKRTSHGMILGEGGEKMSKSKGNVINPDDMVDRFGADTLRLYEMFIGPFDQHVSWSSDSMVGLRRFIERIYKLKDKVFKNKKNSSTDSEELDILLNQTIKKVGEDIEKMKFNTAVSSMMIFVNKVFEGNGIEKNSLENFLKILSPFAPHVSEEVWEEIGNISLLCLEEWPKFNKDKIETITKEIKIVVQINGKIRGDMNINRGMKEDEVKELALKKDFVLKWLNEKEPKRVIYVKDKLVSIVA